MSSLLIEEKGDLQYDTISMLRPETQGHNLIVKVLRTTVTLEKNRSDGTTVRVTECVVGDATGIVSFLAFQDQVDMVKPGTILQIQNGSVKMFQGYMRLSVDKWGSVTKKEMKMSPFINEEHDMSATRYECIS